MRLGCPVGARSIPLQGIIVNISDNLENLRFHLWLTILVAPGMAVGSFPSAGKPGYHERWDQK